MKGTEANYESLSPLFHEDAQISPLFYEDDQISPLFHEGAQNLPINYLITLPGHDPKTGTRQPACHVRNLLAALTLYARRIAVQTALQKSCG
jgi:hypothetical protein